MSDPNDSSIPVLHEILVPGNPAPAHHASATQSVSDPGTAHEPVLVPESVPAPESLHAQEEPARTPQPAHGTEHVHPAEHAHPKKRARAHHAADHRHAHEPAFVPSAGVFDRAEPHAPIEAGATVPPDMAYESPAQPHANLDADVIAERLRGRFAGFLTGEGRGIIEARCRDALQDHTSWLVNQITREVALALETELTGWVKEAVNQEIARRSGNA
ncbi:DUF2486 family protein [Paraburkholderia sediminicola]|uniref:DUF2486 family protein n=1 Tax=Paraburkholderia sediminicola TaxID=458836 RepID=UPI0038BBF378